MDLDARFKAALAIADASKKLFYIASLSANTLIYKGMLTASQIETMFPDLTNPAMESALGEAYTEPAADVRGYIESVKHVPA